MLSYEGWNRKAECHLCELCWTVCIRPLTVVTTLGMSANDLKHSMGTDRGVINKFGY